MNTVKMCQHLELSYKNRLVILALTLLQSLSAVRGAQSAGSLKVVYAVNAGGREHTDSSGIHYDADPLHNKIGTASDYGNNLLIIGRVPEQDEILYRTERYHTATFGYDIPIDGDGEYALIMKFCEVYFNEPNKKVFDVQLNKQHTIVSQLDIYKQVGHGTAHEESIQFAVINGKLYFKDEQSEVRNGMVRLDFIKGTRDNPKINAFALLKGDTKHIPKLPPLAQRQQEHPDADLFEERKPQQQPAQNDIFDDDEDEDDVEEEFDDNANAEDVEDAIDNEVVRQGRSVNERVEKPIDPDEAIFHERKVSGPRHPNPYIIDDSAVLLPLFVAIAAFIPMLYCLCKL